MLLRVFSLFSWKNCSVKTTHVHANCVWFFWVDLSGFHCGVTILEMYWGKYMSPGVYKDHVVHLGFFSRLTTAVILLWLWRGLLQQALTTQQSTGSVERHRGSGYTCLQSTCISIFFDKLHCICGVEWKRRAEEEVILSFISVFLFLSCLGSRSLNYCHILV